jgi:hypothetical protein
MSSFFKSAYFRICPGCQKHGSIIWNNGSESLRIASKDAGIYAVGLFLQKEHLIVKSVLPEKATEKDYFWFEITKNNLFSEIMEDCKWDNESPQNTVFPIMSSSALSQ